MTGLSKALTKAGFDPSRIEERAALLAKAAGMKRKRTSGDEDGDAEMGVDEGGWVDEPEAEAEVRMEVDGEGAHKTRKMMRTEKGARKAVVFKVDRKPRTDRSVAGMSDATVSFHACPFSISFVPIESIVSLANREGEEESRDGGAQDERYRAEARVRSRDTYQEGQSTSTTYYTPPVANSGLPFQPKHLFSGKRSFKADHR